MEKAKREALKRVRIVFHKYTECVYVKGLDNLSREEMEDTYAVNRDQKIPTYDEMKEQIFSKLLSERFRFVQVAPEHANCAVRIFRKEMDVNGKSGGLCGAVCFVKNPMGKWTTVTSEEKEVEMTYEETYEVKYWTSLLTMYNNPVMADYYDVYLKVVTI